MKKIVLTLSLMTIFLLSIRSVSALDYIDGQYTNNLGIVMTEENVENLFNLGFLESEIANMREDIYIANKDLIGEVVASTIKYYKTETYVANYNYSQFNLMSINNLLLSKTIEISQEEYESANDGDIVPLDLSYDVVVTEYKSMYVTITSVNNKYRYKNSVTWKKLPFWKTIDIIGIGIESDKVYTVVGSDKFSAYYENGGGTTTSGTWKYATTGTALTFKWPSAGSGKFYANLYFDVGKQDASKTVTVLNAYGDYAHLQGLNTGASVGVSIGQDGLSISGSLASSFDSMSTARAQLTDISW